MYYLGGADNVFGVNTRSKRPLVYLEEEGRMNEEQMD
jgi:hypothetical protein